MSRIAAVTVTPVAFQDPPLLNAVGVHEPFALRAIVEVTTDSGVTGLGETYADEGHLARLRLVAEAVTGQDVFALNRIHAHAARALAGATGSDGHGLTGTITTGGTVDRVFSPVEVACLDIQGKLLGRPVSDLLGGAVRERVPFSAYLFYKWAAHPGAEPDAWGEALDPAGIVAQARSMVDRFGFTAAKLKGGVLPPEQEIAAIRALREEFPTLPLRLDPNAAWSVETSVEVGKELAGVLEYLEDPTAGIPGMAEVAARVPMPLATNMCVVGFDEVAAAVRAGSVGVILSDHHYWGGLQRSRLLAGICETFGLGLSMHSNSHLGVSLAAMVHLAAATPNLGYACDTHWPWKREDEDVVHPGALTFAGGSVAVPTAPGLGVELDRDALTRLHRQYLDCGLRSRDDTGYMRRVDPAYRLVQPRW
ncbi:glucarate dehydratase family protein [Streptacidiphilus neutrinimicus]|uniref:glucarate dehydratase family protein n=1 Tax=Streptacidiphilus neutrinimicus TaxID=105420 RepID=UPI0005A6CE70|nr:glucarate dehydratase family protein [Streptacidiphilus neutrinimicus]